MSAPLWEAVAEPSDRFPSCHCSTALMLRNGDLLAGYYAGEGEARPDAAWVLARKAAGSAEWGPLSIVADASGKPEGNGILFENARGEVVLVWGTMHGKLDGPYGPGVRWVTCDLKMKVSDDAGVTWSEDRMIETELGHVPHSKPIRLANGSIIFGTEFKGGYSRFWISTDEGHSWSETGPLSGEPNQHPTLIERSDGSVLALLRPSGKHSRVLRSVSDDGGHTWSDAVLTDLPCPHAAIDAVKLADGRVALVWNNNADARNPLTLTVSEDEGETWVATRDLIAGEGSFHYPAIIEGTPGRLHVTFTNNRRTIDHVELSTEWIYGDGPDLVAWVDEGTVRGAQ